MKGRVILTLLALGIFSQLKAQISEGGTPPSFNYTSSLRSELVSKDIPVTFNVEDLLLTDEWLVSNGSPLRVATSIPVDLTIEKDGYWSELPGGEKIWQLRIRAEGAKALMLYYKAFFIPEGGKLFIYNADKTQVLGAYTHKTNPRQDAFATEFVAGDDLILEYVAAPSDEQPLIEINEIGYGYNHLEVTYDSELRSSGSCMVNINCSEGTAWQKEKAGVCSTVQKIGKSSYICSGSLVNNTAKDFKPYVLMAYHCMEASSGSSGKTVSTAEEMKQWLFYFNYERLGCTNSFPATTKTMTGCTKMASSPLDGGSDGLLLLLDQEIPEDYNVYYNGWDRTNTEPLSGVNIHHPDGDYKKISTYTKKGEHATWQGSDSVIGARTAHWNVIFAETENGHGVTEGGSSGSPLFNQNHLIVGTLSGGSSSCDNLNGLNLFGKLAYHWNKNGLADTTRMDIWLDPEGSGVETLEGLSRTISKPAPTGLTLSYNNNTIKLTWTAPETDETPVQYNIYRTNQLIGSSKSTSYTDAGINVTGEVLYGITAVYADESESSQLNGSIVIQEYKAPEGLTMNQNGNEVSLSWTKPVYQQAISWSNDLTYLLKFDIPVYYGHAWDTDDLENIKNYYITAVEFYIAKEATYEICIVQGSRTYKQAVTNPSSSGITRVELTTPFLVKSITELIVSIYTSCSDDEVWTIGCDAGPAVIQKGNLISEDAEEWFVLHDGTEESDDDYDLNFYLAAIVSSDAESTTTTSLTAKSTSEKNSLTKYAGRKLQKTANFSSLRSTSSIEYQYPAAFPSITGYKVYRNSELLTTDPITVTEYIDKSSPAGLHVYGVSTMYGDEESEKMTTPEVSVSNEQISTEKATVSPTLFKDKIRVLNAHLVEKIEIYSMNGLLVRQIRHPEETIQTSSFVPGVYIFKLYTQDGILTHQGIKK